MKSLCGIQKTYRHAINAWEAIKQEHNNFNFAQDICLNISKT